MEIYLSLLALVGLSCYVHCVQFEDEANLEQTQQRGFFPSSDEPDERYSEISGIKYVDPQRFSADTFVDNRKQLSLNGNHASPVGSQFYQSNSYRPINSVTVVRKRPMKSPYQYASAPSNYYNSIPPDLSNPFYQNYANHYQYPSATASPFPDYYNPTRYPSGAIVSGQQALLQQPSLQYPSYYTNNYANQFGYQRPSSSSYGSNGVIGGAASGISNFFNNIRESTTGPLGQISQVGGQFGKALEEISANDELQCVPKILCQVVKSQRRPNQMTSLLNAPGLSAIISALPSSSPLMNFGRAALLGLSGVGEYSGVCDSAYPRCPRDEEQMLYYLNNHRGGFFRFFNGGNSYGDESSLQQQQQQLGGLNDAGSSQGLNLLALQALAESLNQGGGGGNGINLSNLFSSPSNQRPAAQLSPGYPGLPAGQSQSNGLLGGMFNSLSDVVSNLLTGVVGTRFSRRANKRDDRDQISGEGRHKIEKRIVNLKGNVAQAEESFFRESSINQQQNTLLNLEEPFTFSNGNRINNAPQPEPSLSLKFPKENQNQNVKQEIRFQEINQETLLTPSDVAQRLKALFPEAAGLLRFDNDQFNRELLRTLVNDRIGKILTGVHQQRPINNNYAVNPSVNRYQGNEGINSNLYYPAQSQSHAGVGSSNYNNYNSNYINRGQQQQQPQQSNDDRRHLVYITNSRGQTEYTLNELTGEKKRVT